MRRLSTGTSSTPIPTLVSFLLSSWSFLCTECLASNHVGWH
jgi:hypothetical protein